MTSNYATRRKPHYRKIVVVGDGACGKTSLLNVYVQGTFPEHYEPTVFENHTVAVELQEDNETVELALWDTAGQEEFDMLRSLSYADTHVILLCFSVDNPVSLDNIEDKWLDEVQTQCPGVKICMVALKCDLREDPSVIQKLALRGEKPVAYEQGLAVARRARASRYLECSAKHGRGITEVFTEAAKVSLKAPKQGQTRTSAMEDDRHGSSKMFGCFRW